MNTSRKVSCLATKPACTSGVSLRPALRERTAGRCWPTQSSVQLTLSRPPTIVTMTLADAPAESLQDHGPGCQAGAHPRSALAPCDAVGAVTQLPRALLERAAGWRPLARPPFPLEELERKADGGE